MSATIADARAVLAGFSPESPMMVTPNQYRAMAAEPGIADMLNRVRVAPSIPLDTRKRSSGRNN